MESQATKGKQHMSLAPFFTRQQRHGGGRQALSPRSREMEDINRRYGDLIQTFFSDPIGLIGTAVTPPVDIEETDDAYVVDVDLPSVRPEDVNIEMRGEELRISGQVQQRERTGVVRRQNRPTAGSGRARGSTAPTASGSGSWSTSWPTTRWTSSSGSSCTRIPCPAGTCTRTPTRSRTCGNGAWCSPWGATCCTTRPSRGPTPRTTTRRPGRCRRGCAARGRGSPRPGEPLR